MLGKDIHVCRCLTLSAIVKVYRSGWFPLNSWRSFFLLSASLAEANVFCILVVAALVEEVVLGICLLFVSQIY